jgi:microcystin degradation protein MlrC
VKSPYNLLFSLIILSLFSCNTTSSDALPRIAIAGLGIESSTFSPAQTTEEAFHAQQGMEIMAHYPFLKPESRNRLRAKWFPALRGKSLPGGIVTRNAYESLMKKMLDQLKKNLPYDGLFFDIHGAMSVVGLDDPEGDMITRIREVVGKETLISTSMDLHGNVSKRLAHQSDLITCYRMAPHEDAIISKQRALENLLNRLENGKGKPPYKAWIAVPILLPGEKTSTRIEPGKSLYAKVPEAEAKAGIIDAAIWMGYPWADEPRNHGVVMVTGDDHKAVVENAEHLAQYYWKVRNEFVFVAPTTSFEESMALALKSKNKPFIISDMGDNPTAGGAGDVTWTLKEILNIPVFQSTTGPELIYTSIPGPDFITKALEAGEGAVVTGSVGAMEDDRYSGPIVLTAKILAIRKGDVHAAVEVVAQVGSVKVIVTQKRKPYHYEKDFTQLGLKPRNTDILVVKIGYLVPELYDMRGGWTMALTPGGVDQNLQRLEYRRINRPMFPLDREFPDLDLSAQLIPTSDRTLKK